MTWLSVKPRLTLDPAPARRQRHVDNDEYASFCRRIIRAYARRVANGDEIDLAEMVTLREEMDEAIAAAVAGMRGHGHSWSYIAAGLGTSRQAAQMRFGRSA